MGQLLSQADPRANRQRKAGVWGEGVARRAPVVLLPHMQAQLGAAVREWEVTSRPSSPSSFPSIAITQQSLGWVEISMVRNTLVMTNSLPVDFLPYSIILAM